jgi:hypothetical protein
MRKRTNAGSGVLFVVLLVMAILIYDVPAVKSFLFGLPLLALVAIIAGASFGLAALVRFTKHRSKHRTKRQR